MSSPRDTFLQRVREAVAAGNRPGSAAAIPGRDGVGYQGAGADPVIRFRDELTTAGGVPYLVADGPAAVEQAVALAQARSARRVLLGRGPFIDRLDLADRLHRLGALVVTPESCTAATCRDPYFAADLAITGTDALIAETGSLVFLARPDNPRSFSLLPPIHVVVAERSQLLADLFDLFEPSFWEGRGGLPSGFSIVTGPSKTGDIELRLVTGVHGPGELHVIVAGDGQAAGVLPPLAPASGERGRG